MPTDTMQTRDHRAMDTVIAELAIATSGITYHDHEAARWAAKLATAAERGDDLGFRVTQYRDAVAGGQRWRAKFAAIVHAARVDGWRDEVVRDALAAHVAQSGDRYVRRALRRFDDLLADDLDDPYVPA